ncbi:Selenide, water dikinase [Sporotomaculum syntrophicum]|uniref:Selenide, water dikinase n=2 Tax=Sporotomaculum syntrophicum TaxID=182264 RepID=A0A9D2WNL9_9FIRM|nr:Selenide, water dikinase [Sporotomaculum syntrophicum]
MVNDPYLFGQIAAANALSDVYAMGGQPLLAMNIVCFPDCLPIAILGEILRGGADKVAEAGCIIAGGHSVRDDEPKYGLAVAGLVPPGRIISNATARPGDKMVLTKPLGTGIINTAIKADLLSTHAFERAVQCMSALNKKASAAMQHYEASACTDITGFGLLGHAAEIAEASQVSLEICFSAIPLLPEVLEMARMGLIPAGAYNNKEHLGDKVTFDNSLRLEEQMILYDPQTSGGLLIVIAEANADRLVVNLREQGVPSAVIGRVLPNQQELIQVIK